MDTSNYKLYTVISLTYTFQKDEKIPHWHNEYFIKMFYIWYFLSRFVSLEGLKFKCYFFVCQRNICMKWIYFYCCFHYNSICCSYDTWRNRILPWARRRHHVALQKGKKWARQILMTSHQSGRSHWWAIMFWLTAIYSQWRTPIETPPNYTSMLGIKVC